MEPWKWIDLDTATASNFVYKGTPLPEWTPTLVNKTADWTLEEMTSLMVRVLVKDGLSGNVQYFIRAQEESCEQTEGIINVQRLFEFKRTADDSRNMVMKSPAPKLTFHFLALALYLFGNAAKDNPTECCMGCQLRPRRGPAVKCVYIDIGIAKGKCTNCVYYNRKTCNPSEKFGTKLFEMRNAGDKLFPDTRRVLTMRELEWLEHLLDAKIGERVYRMQSALRRTKDISD
ncbi:hypothetical protein V8F06_013490 [Rhypophila decipiens]